MTYFMCRRILHLLAYLGGSSTTSLTTFLYSNKVIKLRFIDLASTTDFPPPSLVVLLNGLGFSG
jgi:hypothetical protein